MNSSDVTAAPIFAARTAFFLATTNKARKSYGEVVEDEALLKFLTKKIMSLTGSSSKSFPIPQPLSFRRTVIKEIMNDDYLVALKSDGVRAMLLMTIFETEPISVLVDRKMKFSRVEVWAPRSYFDDSLFDAEIVVEKENDVLLVFDAYAIEGKSLLLHEYEKRIELFSNSISSNEDENYLIETNRFLIPSNTGLLVRAKCIQRISFVKESWQRRLMIPHANDGLIFTRNSTHVQGCAVYKWKFCHTVDVLIKRNSTSIFSGNAKVIKKLVLDKKCFDVDKLKQQNQILVSYFQSSSKNVVVECAVDVDLYRNVITFTPIKIRSDKVHPNSIHTIKETVINHIEDVKVDEFVSTNCVQQQQTTKSVGKKRKKN